MFKKFLIIGSIPYQKRKKSIGGTTVLMKNLLEYFSSNKIDYSFISSNSFDGKFSFLLNYLTVVLKSILLIPFSKIIMVNCSRNGAFYLYPLIFLIAKLFNKKIIFRMFGGNFIDLCESSNYFKKNILLLVLRYTDLICVETKYIITYLKSVIGESNDILWLPNVRNKVKNVKSKSFSKKFAFISHVKETKGVDNIIESASKCSHEYSFDFYGFISDKKYENDFINKQKNCTYLGVLNGSEVIPTLSQYDVVLLPSFHPGEGYPGIIIESFSLGKPVIASNLEGISEIVSNNKTGLLVPIKNTEALLGAIKFFNNENYDIFSKNALKEFENYDSEKVYLTLLNRIEQL
tara:strand:- start:2396 stop:3439 length:1044 start_codon:yes stop_codon:yes gene_type:complete